MTTAHESDSGRTMQRQLSPHGTPAWKHSQYFFWHADFLQWHPFLCIFFTPLRDPERPVVPLAPLTGVANAPGVPDVVRGVACARPGVAPPTPDVDSILGLNAFGFFSKRAAIACCRISSNAGVFAQPWQLQLSSQ